MLSELEGAILLEVEMRERKTAFQVRKAFINSPTSDWSGSAGSIYPAIKRLVKCGFISQVKKDDARGTKEIFLSEEGKKALRIWASDPERTVSLRSDPFRTRVDYLTKLSKAEKRKVYSQIEKALCQKIKELDKLLSVEDESKVEANLLAKLLLLARKDWISAQLDKVSN